MSNADLIFLPWVRRGGAAALQGADSLGAAQPGAVGTTVELLVNESPGVSVPVRLMGPGHVTALLPGQVIRTDPTRGSRAFEPNYLPLVEFDEPSLPWLFTPAAANPAQQLRPWLCLVVVRVQPGVGLDPPGRGSLPVLRIATPAVPSAELPDLDDSWAWAHAQLTEGSGASADDLIRLLDNRPERSLSRLVCGRILHPLTDYLACVVPTFGLGVKAGLGDDITLTEEGTLQPAWTLGPDLGSVELPVYHHWTFATGEGGDFQSLAMLLKARPLPDTVGVRPFAITDSIPEAELPDPTVLDLGGALQPLRPAPDRWPSATVRQRFRTELAGILNLVDTVPAEQPLLAPPRYGGVQAGRTAIDPAPDDDWYAQLNLDPTGRLAAAYGTRVVQDQQELLMTAAWEQAAELRRVNDLLRHAEFGRAVATSLHRRFLSPMSPDAGLQVLGPAQARLSRTAAAHRPETGLIARLAATGLPSTAYAMAVRRTTRPQGAVARRIRRAPVVPGAPVVLTGILRNLQPVVFLGRLVIKPVVDGVGLATLERVASSLAQPRFDLQWPIGSGTQVAEAPPRPGFTVVDFDWPRPRPRPIPPVGPIGPIGPIEPLDPLTPASPAVLGPGVIRARRKPIEPDEPDDPVDPIDPIEPIEPPIVFPLRDNAAAAAFRAASRAHLDGFVPPRPPPDRPTFPTGTLGEVFAEAILLTVPAETYAFQVSLLIDRKSGAAPTEERALSEATFVPRFATPMATSLTELGQDLLLPGLDGVPPNTVVPLRTNTAFIEAYLVGLNAEFGRELLWREFPSPPQATYFDRFWDPGPNSGRPPDIPPLAEWANRDLGAPAGTGERFVMLVRSELLRRFPHAVVYATRADPNGLPQVAHPIFSGAMEPDVRFYGFDIAAADIETWSLVIAEQPTAPRFGVEVGAAPVGPSHLPAGPGHAAQLARQLRQTPVRITIPATVLLREDEEGP